MGTNRALRMLVCVAALAASGIWAEAQSLHVDADPKLTEAYEKLVTAARGHDFARIAELAQRALSLERSWVCLTRGPKGAYLGVAEGILTQLFALPPAAWAPYEREAGAAAQEAAATARRAGDVAALATVAFRYPLTHAGRDALAEAAQRALADGRAAEALVLGERFLIRYGANPGSGDAGTAAARALGEALLGAGGWSAEQAQSLSAAFARLELAGVVGAKGLRERAERMLESMRAEAGAPWDGSAWGGRTGSAIMTPLRDIGEALWSYRYPATQEYFVPQAVMEWDSAADSPVMHAIADRDRIYLVDGQTVSAMDRGRGFSANAPQPAWRHYYRLPLVSNDSNRTPSPVDLGRSTAYVPVLDDRSIYAVIGGCSPMVQSGQTAVAGRPQVLCLDRASGARRWMLDPDSSVTPAEVAGLTVYGLPLPVGDRLLLLGISDNRPSIVALDRRDGRMLWRTTLPTLVQGDTYTPERIGQLGVPALAERHGWVYFCTNTGVAAVVDAVTGAPRWAASYRADRGRVSPMDRVPHGQPPSCNPTVLTEGLMIFHAAGSSRLIALDQETGEARWGAVEIPELHHLYGAREGTVYVSGTFAAAVDVRTGKLKWRSDLPERGNGGRGGLTSEGMVCVGGARISVLDYETGRPRIRWAWHGINRMVGNLLLTGDSLVIAGTNELTVFRLNPVPVPAAGDSAEDLVQALGSDDPQRREQASAALAAAGGLAKEALTLGAQTEDAEVSWRCRCLLERLEQSALLERE